MIDLNELELKRMAWRNQTNLPKKQHQSQLTANSWYRLVNYELVKKWKKLVKSKLKALQSWYDMTFFQFDRGKLEFALTKLGIKTGDTVFVHSSFDAFRGFKGKPTDIIQMLKSLVGMNGVIMLPTMAITTTAVDYALENPIVDLKRTQSRMGLITELFRRTPGVFRSLHPTHPIAVWGNDAQTIVADHHLAKTPCGFPSPLYQLYERNGKILLLGTGIEVLTFFHTVEEILEHKLSVNPFTENSFDLQVKDEKGQLWDCNTRLYEPSVSRRRRLYPLLNELKRMQALNECKVGKLHIQLFLAKDVLKAVQHLIDCGISCYE